MQIPARYILGILAALIVGFVAYLYWPTASKRAMKRVNALDGTIYEQQEPGTGRYIRVLFLTLRPVTTEDLIALRDIRPLDRIMLDGSPVNDDGLAALAELEELEYLSLTGPKVTDAGVKHLAALPRLAVLSLKLTAVTDAAIPDLARMTALHTLNIAGTQITDAGLSRLQAALPETNIVLHASTD